MAVGICTSSSATASSRCTPRVKLPDGRMVLVERDWTGKLSDFTLLFEAMVQTHAQQIPVAAAARAVGEPWQPHTPQSASATSSWCWPGPFRPARRTPPSTRCPASVDTTTHTCCRRRRMQDCVRHRRREGH
jgi:hypothetical protein